VGRYGRTVIIIAVVVIAAGLALGFQTFSVGGFQRGSDNTLLGLSLGLDLQGGSHLVYQTNLVDPNTGARVEVTQDQMDALKLNIERRVNSSGLGEPIIQILGTDRLLVQMPGLDDPARAKRIIGETARLEFKRRTFNVSRDLTEITAADIAGVTVDYLPDPSPATSTDQLATSTQDAQAGTQLVTLMVEFTEEGAEKFLPVFVRMNESFFRYQIAQQEFFQRLQQDPNAVPSVDIVPDTLDISVEGNMSQRYTASAASTNRLDTTTYAFVVPAEEDTGEQPTLQVARDRVGNNAQLLFTEITGTVDEPIGLTGDNLSRAFPGQHTQSGIPIVNLEFDSEGTRIFGELTLDIVRKQETEGVRDQIAIFLDDQELISPTVQTAITAGTAIIQGRDFTVERVRDISLQLEAGRLPVPIELIQERDVDAILGADSLAKSVVAGLVGLSLVLLFMTMYYRLPGLVASIALMIYATLVLALFKVFPVTLTLSGVAAVILSIGMAVDANILIFERMKDELRAGRTLLSSINIGFDRAWPAIRDGNISTLITCGILFWFADQLGASIVQGFAVTLAIGVVVSMFTAITVSRTLLRFVGTTRLTRSMRIWLPSGGSEVPQQFLTDTAD
jgi:protein-export membrane protein SecD